MSVVGQVLTAIALAAVIAGMLIYWYRTKDK